MKKIYIFLLMLATVAGCRKDPAAKSGQNKNPQSYEGYIIQGKMKGVIVTDGGLEMPFLLILKADHKATLVNVTGEMTLSYSSEEGKIVLADHGYFNIKDGAITDWLIAGLNFTKAALHQLPATNQLKGKAFRGTVFSVKIGSSIGTGFKFDASLNQFTYPNSDSGNIYAYNVYGNIAGFRHSNDYDTNDFFMLENGKLECAGYSAFNGLSVGTLDPM